ncbi:MAG: ATP-dependent DNA helicase RecG, partial [Pyrinomonadaceae bacterium]|nr:ATP-dependent DNA helicase RecG [Pyrinomonadaceae bacterium]
MSQLKLNNAIFDFNKLGIANLSEAMARRLALAVATFAGKSDATESTVEDLLNYLPMRWEDRSNLTKIGELTEGAETAVELYVRVSGGFQVGKNRGAKAPPLYIFEITASDVERLHKPVVIFWFVAGKMAQHVINYHAKRFQRGVRFVAFGKWEFDTRRNTYALRLNKPDELEILPTDADIENFGLLKTIYAADDADEYKEKSTAQNSKSKRQDDEDFDDDEMHSAIHVGRRVPVYRKLGQFQTKRLREIMFDVVNSLDVDSVKESLPPDLVKRQNLISRIDALKGMHFPPENANIAQYESARSQSHLRLIFEEFFWSAFALAFKRGERTKESKGAIIEISDTIRSRIFNILPFTLTNAQQRVTTRIFDDIQSDAPMNRLIQGDVGSGKTIVAVLAMLAAMENGYQTALMSPTEILAEQHARNVKKLLAKTPYRVELLTGSLKAKEKRERQAALKNGEINAAIGTHALIQEAVEFEKLGLVVIDEQHRFGVLQRAELRKRGFNPDVLVMTATPIPRSLAMTVYGDLEVSIIDELPPGRTPIKTVVCGEDQRAGVYRGITREVDLGRQVYVVYPLVEESEKLDLKAATLMHEELTKTFPQYKVGLLHGKMKSVDKESVMKQFLANEFQVLVSTTVIEVGVDVPNASLMIIEHAERFGLSQLHQLRGRVGRGAEKSFCVLLTGDKKTAV